MTRALIVFYPEAPVQIDLGRGARTTPFATKSCGSTGIFNDITLGLSTPHGCRCTYHINS
jgi:hypothetical protein